MSRKLSIEGAFASFPEQLTQAKRLGRDLSIIGTVSKICVCAAGSTITPGMLLPALLPDTPSSVITDYFLPKDVNKQTLVLLLSYSGDTEEVLNCFRQGLRIGCKMVAITSGGKLKDFCVQYKIPYVLIPNNLPCHAALGYLLFPMLNILKSAGLADMGKEMDQAITLIKKADFSQHSEQLASLLKDKTPIIYSSERMRGVAYRWKMSFNEIPKRHAFVNTFPKINHNEMAAFENSDLPTHVIILNDDDDYKRVRNRAKLTKSFISGNVSVTELKISGKDPLSKALSTIYLGELTALKVAEILGIDSEPPESIERFKKELGTYYI